MMNFTTIAQARAYVREMSVEDTEAISGAEVWQFGNGEVLVIKPGDDRSELGDGTLAGTVAQLLY